MSEIRLQEWIRPAIKGVVIKGALLRHYDMEGDLAILDQDILEVELPNGIVIDVGWFPENSPHGMFLIRTYRQNHRSLLISPSETKDPFEVARRVVDLVEIYAAPAPARAISISHSGSKSFEYRAEIAGTLMA
jgi:hypothetical protein